MRIIHDLDEMTETARGWLASGSVGFVSTMGRLHTGHVALVQAARQECEISVVSILRNSQQFGFDEDVPVRAYNLTKDLQLLEKEDVDVVFIPRPEDIFPRQFSTYVVPLGTIAERLEGSIRPDYFRVIATVIMKLCHLVRPDVIFLGQKDAQQAALYRKLVRDFYIDVSIRVLPTVRESDGLAISSRNYFLSKAERQVAPVLYKALLTAKARIEKGERRRTVIEKSMLDLIATEPLVKPDYVDICNPDTFEEVAKTLPALLPDLLLVVAARVGTTRLIDNIAWKRGGYWLT